MYNGLIKALCLTLHRSFIMRTNYDAKSELCKIVSALQPDVAPPDGWSKFVNSKGVPVVRRTSDSVHRRRAESVDLIQMLALLDVNKVPLPPKFVIGDPDRVPTGVLSQSIY